MSILYNNISTKGIELIEKSLHNNNTMLFIYYEQYGIDIPQLVRQSIKKKLSENIKNLLNIDYTEFTTSKLRFIKGSNKLKNIDSEYRNKM